MSIFRTVAMLASATLVIFFFYCIGFALAEHSLRPVLFGVGALIGAVVLLGLQLRVGAGGRM
jgi:hypothetical protein